MQGLVKDLAGPSSERKKRRNRQLKETPLENSDGASNAVNDKIYF
jgi:hypothetical protein